MKKVLPDDTAGLLYLRGIVETGKGLRSIFTVRERPAGDVYIRLKSGINIGQDNARPIKQHKYSAHASPNSRDYTVIKRTMLLKDGKETTLTSLTNAVKSRNGFTHIFSHSFSDLESPEYNPTIDKATTLSLAKFDPNDHTFHIGLFIGHPDSEFPSSGYETVTSFQSQLFKFVVCDAGSDFPATMFGFTSDTTTFPPEDFPEGPDRDAARALMSGRSPEECTALFHYLNKQMYLRKLRTLHDLTEEQEAKDWYQQLLRINSEDQASY